MALRANLRLASAHPVLRAVWPVFVLCEPRAHDLDHIE